MAPPTRSPDPARRDSDGTLVRLLDRLRCPGCGGGLADVRDALACDGCGTRWPVVDGVACLARRGTAETWSAPTASETSAWYQGRYDEADEAARYNEAYRRAATKRWSTRREFALLARLLDACDAGGVVLDLPCGGGRLSPALARRAELLVEADIAIGQVEHARKTRGDWTAAYLTASAFHIPFRDASLDGVVSSRLCHHLPTSAERERLVAELLRVSRSFAIMTFFDHASFKNLVRRARRPFDGKPPKMTMTVGRVAALAREHGAELVAAPPLSRFFSGHRYALLVKRTA